MSFPRAIRRVACHAAAVLLPLLGSVRAEDMTVYTTVSRLGSRTDDTRIVSRSLTLFHAGKVYDYIEEAGEVVVLEPVHSRFVILNGDYLAARVEFAELQQLLQVARYEAERYLHELSVKTDRRSRNLAAVLESQLQPRFRHEYEPTLERLKLVSPALDYEVKAARLPSTELTEQYLTYADWASRLNYVLHPSSMYPAPRLDLNARLREHGVVPTTVEVRSRGEAPLRLRAEHRFSFKLLEPDRSLITKWERLLSESGQVRWVTIHEYQKQTHAAPAKRSQ